MKTRLTGAALFVLAALIVAGPARAGIEVSPDFPTQGQPAAVTVTDADVNAMRGVSVQAVYRPGSEVSHTEDVGKTADDGTIAWTPSGAGVVTLQTVPQADEAAITHTLSVRFDGVPISGLLILLGAGVILYGGVIRGVRSLLALPPILPPDT